MLGFKGVPTPLFEWKHPEMAKAFDPVFLAYHSLFNEMPIGFFFQVTAFFFQGTSAHKIVSCFILLY